MFHDPGLSALKVHKIVDTDVFARLDVRGDGLVKHDRLLQD
jgi:hypothetical protein